MNVNLTYSEACSLYDYHERTGLLPSDINEDQFDEIMKFYNIESTDFEGLDPAGGTGLYSHI